ncbi:MAG TPA: DinB family protein [Acidimicrobiales bacterium]|nr:DinB family protein [Acidimicrobiales bacterium]
MVACDECGYVYEELPVPEIAVTLRSFGPRYREALGGASAAAASKRPRPDVWSALEYACHVRDVFLVQRERVVLAQVEDRPSFVRMYRDERVPLCGYSTSSLDPVVDQLRMAAELCAGVFTAVQEGSWSRTFLYNWPSTDEHDLAWLGRHTVHEGLHHLMDVGRVLAQVT